jgi:hypothetical protein
MPLKSKKGLAEFKKGKNMGDRPDGSCDSGGTNKILLIITTKIEDK